MVQKRLSWRTHRKLRQVKKDKVKKRTRLLYRKRLSVIDNAIEKLVKEVSVKTKSY